MPKIFLKILDTCEFEKRFGIITAEKWTFQNYTYNDKLPKAVQM